MIINYDINVDYFAVLGVHYGACPQTVKLAYRKMARRYHPDVSKIHDAQKRFQDIALAYEVLSKYREDYCQEFDFNKVQSQGFDLKPAQQPDTTSRANWAESNEFVNMNSEDFKKAPTSDKQAVDSDEPVSAYRTQKPIDGKDRVINYPLTLRYAIRLLTLGSFYIPGLKLNMKFSRKAFEEKTFRLEGKGYSGLFGGKPGDFFVQFSIKIDSSRYKLKGGDIYGSFAIPKTLLKAGEVIGLDVVSGRVEVEVPEGYSAEKFIKVEGRGLPADEYTAAGDLYIRLIAS